MNSGHYKDPVTGREFTAASVLARKARLHKVISYWKSGFRLAGYLMLLVDIPVAAAVLFFSESLGIAEEIWGA